MARKRRFKLPAFLEVLKDGKPGFVGAEKVLADEELRGQVVNKGLAEAKEWLERYGAFLEYLARNTDDLAPFTAGWKIARTIRRLRKELGDDWPTLPEEDE